MKILKKYIERVLGNHETKKNFIIGAMGETVNIFDFSPVI